MLLGCVADDFTGASDAASFLQAGGATVILSNGIPEGEFQTDSAQAVVIALKTRTIPVSEAVQQSLAAFRWLKSQGASILYFKYCSTFDSTEKGNIGPVLDAVMDEWDIPYTLLCPTLLENGRQVKSGVLYVKGVPLAESSMKDHPLTPMRDSQIKNLMKSQSRYPCYLCGEELPDRGKYYLIPDFYEEIHGKQIVKKFGKLPFLSGGSGLLKALAESWNKGEGEPAYQFSSSKNPIILAGSCSTATREQIQYFQKHGGVSYKIHPVQYALGIQNLERIKNFLGQNQEVPVLLYTSADPDEVGEIKRQWDLSYGRLDNFIEQILAEAAVYALESGRKTVIAAGGETSGAVMQKLGFSMFYIGPSISPGVPVMCPVEQSDRSLILKSGNFGEEDFFVKASLL